MENSPVIPMSAICILILLSVASVINASFSDAEKKILVDIHNELRESAFPSAEAMRQVTWSTNLESLAKAAAGRCDDEHTKDLKFGENIYKVMGAETDPKRVVRAWYSEKSTYNKEMTPCKGCGHYTQVLTADVTEIGCEVNRKCKLNADTVDLTYCLYNVQNAYFKRGPVCSSCPATMPVCMNGLCVSKTTAEKNASSKDEIQCLLKCRNCGKLVTDASKPGDCRCDCSGTDATGDLCETKSSTSTVKCSPCSAGSMSPPCQNGGSPEDESITDPLKCKCKCPTGYLGDRCEISASVFDNSVKLVLSAVEEFKFLKFAIRPPVVKSKFYNKLWPVLQSEMAKAVNSFCRTDSQFAKCCPGKAYPSGAATAEHVKAGDFQFIKTSLGNTFDGELNPLVFATVPSSSLCPAGGSPTYVPQAALLEAIKSAQSSISDQLKSENLLLKDVSNSKATDLQPGVLQIEPSKGSKSASESIPSKLLRVIMFLMPAMIAF